jgi:hypothetical protein
MTTDKGKTGHFWVNGIVAARNQKPYIQLSNEKGLIVQFTMSEARQVAMDILVMAAHTEADAMIFKFFDKAQFPQGAAGALMQEFRDFRAELDREAVERGSEDGDDSEGETP